MPACLNTAAVEVPKGGEVLRVLRFFVASQWPMLKKNQKAEFAAFVNSLNS